MNLIIEDCLHCGAHDVRFDNEAPTQGEIYQFDLCLKCDDEVGAMLSTAEAHATLIRLVDINDGMVYDETRYNPTDTVEIVDWENL